MKIVKLTQNLPAGMIDRQEMFGNIPYLLPDGTAQHIETHMDFCLRSIEELPEEFVNKLLHKHIHNGDLDPNVKTILLIRRGGFGDLLFLSSCIARLKQMRPDVVIDVAASDAFHDVLKHNPHIRRLLPSSFIPANQILEYDAWGFVEKTVEISRFTTKNAPTLFAERLGLPDIDPVPEVYASPELIDEFKRHLDPNLKRIVIQLRGSTLARAWPIPYITELLAPLAALPNTEIFILGKRGMVPEASEAQLEQMAKPLRNVYYAVDTFTMEQVIALIACSDVVVGCDSCFIHIAGGLRTKGEDDNWHHTPVRSVGIYGPFPANRRASYYPLCKTIEAEPRLPCMPCFQHALHPCLQSLKEGAYWSKCMRLVRPNQVFDLIQEQLSDKYPSWLVDRLEENSVIWEDTVIRARSAMTKFQQMPPGVSPYVADRIIELGVIYGSGDEQMLMNLIRSLVTSGTFINVNPVGMPTEMPPRVNPNIRFTVLDNGQSLKLPPITMPDTGEPVDVTILRSQENNLPPVPYNDLLTFWRNRVEQADWYVIMDDDLERFEPAWLQRCITSAERLDLDVWGVELAYFGERFIGLGSLPGFGSGILGISKSAIERIGFLNERDYSFHGADSDYVARAHLARLRAGIIPNSRVARHLGHRASAKRGIFAKLEVLRSNKVLYQQWRSPIPPTEAYIGPKDIAERSFETLDDGSVAVEQIWRKHDKAKQPQLPISVIIPTYEPDQRLAEAIDSLPPVEEIIVVDDASSNGRATEICALYSNVTLLRNRENMNFTATVNRGIEAANPENDVFIFNDDARLLPGYLERLYETAKAYDHFGIISGLHLNPITKQDTALHPDTAPDYKITGIGRYVPMRWCGFCGVYIKRAVINKIGLLDAKRFPMYSSDTEYCLRAARAGFKLFYDTFAKLEHWGGRAVARFRDKDPKRFRQLSQMRIKCTPKTQEELERILIPARR